MEVVLFLKHAVVAVLTAYLAFTNTLASHVLSLIGEPVQVSQPVAREATPSTTPNSVASQELINLSRDFAARTAIPHVLRDHVAFQEAAIAAGVENEPVIQGTITEEALKGALVNIFCEYKTDEYIRTTTGSGFFITSDGVILTNAHVAQFLLLKEVDTTVKKASCTIRTGDPAEARYTADLLYISPTWVMHNAELIDDELPRGTGEYDYALLYVTNSVGESELPSTFPALAPHTELLSRVMDGATVLSAGYPAEKLSREGIRARLIPVVAETTIEELYTFGSNYADIFSLSESPVGKQGTSGGPVADTEKGVVGLIVTKGDVATEGSSSLRALTLSYIDRTITEETGYSLAQNTYGNLAHRGKIFKEALTPFLAHLLEVELR